MKKLDFNIFISFAYNPEYGTYKKDDFENTFKTLFTQIESELADFNLRINPFFEITDEYGSKIPNRIMDKIIKSDLSIVDISVNNPNVLYELGCLTLAGTENFIIKKRELEGEGSGKFAIPMDIDRDLVLYYKDIQHLVTRPDENQNFFKDIKTRIEKLIEKNDFFFRKFYSNLWFPKNTQKIVIVVPPDDEIRIEDHNKIKMDRYGDRDALMHIWGMLHRFYPQTEFEIYTSEDKITKYLFEGNLVIIGGPGSSTLKNNEWARKLFDHRNFISKIVIKYSDDCESMVYKNKNLKSRRDTLNDKIIEDWGYFARLKNPYNENNKVILIQGTHTFGVWGSAIIFSNHPNANQNIKNIINKLGSEKDMLFQTVFSVDVENSIAQCPKLEGINVTPFIVR